MADKTNKCNQCKWRSICREHKTKGRVIDHRTRCLWYEKKEELYDRGRNQIYR